MGKKEKAGGKMLQAITGTISYKQLRSQFKSLANHSSKSRNRLWICHSLRIVELAGFVNIIPV